MKMSRKRAEELSAAGADFVTTYIGPRKVGRMFCTEYAPLTLEACGFFTDTSEWVCESIQFEPEWEVRQFPPDHFYSDRWYGGRKLRDWYGFNLLTWKTKERAEAYLKLLKDDWWDE